MALKYGFRGQLYDDVEPLYCVTVDGGVFDRVTKQWFSTESLAEQMMLAKYEPTADLETAGVGGVEIGIPSAGFIGGGDGGGKWGSPRAGEPRVAGVEGPFSAFGTDFWINAKTCEVGFDIDGNPGPDIWQSTKDVCAGDIEDRVKLAINAQLEALGCNGLPCVTTRGNLQKAFTQKVIQSKEGDK